MPKAKTQADQRRDIVCTDQFNRPWLVAIELATGDPCGIDVAGWTDPLHTPIKYVVMPKNAYGTQQWGTVKVEFDRWIAEVEQYEREYRTRFIEVGREMNKGTFNPAEWSKNEYLKDLVGPPPTPSSAALRMAKAGHRELLGQVPLGPEGRKALGQETLEDMEAEFAAPAPKRRRAPAAPVLPATEPEPTTAQ